MTEHDARLVGEWVKVSADEHAARYPEQLRFDEDGRYSGTAQAQLATGWDGGTWQTFTTGEVALANASHAVMRYRYVLEDETLRFVDTDGMEFGYERA